MLKQLSLALLAVSLTIGQSAMAATGSLAGSPITDANDPLINGASSSPPFVSAPQGMPPPVGAGSTPAPVTPGMGGNPTLLPWVPAVPANNIDLQNSGLSLPITPAVESPPDTLGQLLTPIIPAAPSTPGADPGNLTAPVGSFNPAQDLNVNPGGGIPGTGGYYTTIPTLRRGGQQSHQWELRGRNAALGGIGGDGSQDEVTQLGPASGFGVPFGVPTGNGLRNSSLDLGGGDRMNIGGTKISTGSTVQDYGLSSMRYNGIPSLRAGQSTEYGQGWRRIPKYSSNTTDFGFGYHQFSPANVDPQKTGQLLPPRAVITNF